MKRNFIKTVKLEEELERCMGLDGKMTKIPMISSITEKDGELICNIEGYSEVTENMINNLHEIN